MAASIYLITRTVHPDVGPEGFVDQVSGILINLDPATYTTASAQIAEATKALNATKSTAGTQEDTQGANIPNEFPHNYLDTVQLLGLPTGGVLATANTSIILQDVDLGGASGAVQAAVA